MTFDEWQNLAKKTNSQPPVTLTARMLEQLLLNGRELGLLSDQESIEKVKAGLGAEEDDYYGWHLLSMVSQFCRIKLSEPIEQKAFRGLTSVQRSKARETYLSRYRERGLEESSRNS